MERAAREFPECILDFNDSALYRNCSCPSVNKMSEILALNKEGIEAEIVILTEKPSNSFEASKEFDWIRFSDPQVYGFGEKEAIVIKKYLGKYDLFKF